MKTPPKLPIPSMPVQTPSIVSPFPLMGQDKTGIELSFPLSDGNHVEIRFEKLASKKDFDRVLKLLELCEDSIVNSE